VLYADKHTKSIKQAVKETERRRTLQIAYNKEHVIVPRTIIKAIKEKEIEVKDAKHIPKTEIPNLIVELEVEMREAADKLDFERAIGLREKMNVLKKRVE
jgi:excinuclease ABC subunit B